MDDTLVIKNVVTPNDQVLRNIFSSPQAFYIDIYQREYKWTADNVKILLNDIEMQFESHQRTKVIPEEIPADVKQNFVPYYINTYLTHTTPTKISIVNGQQRLTTFLLIFIKLYHTLKDIEA